MHATRPPIRTAHHPSFIFFPSTLPLAVVATIAAPPPPPPSPRPSAVDLLCTGLLFPSPGLHATMEALRKVVMRQNVLSMTTPPVLRGAQALVGAAGTADVGAAARWGAVLGLTAFWFIEPYDFLRKTFNPPDEGAK
ncbi:hypothetical protein BU14_0087s0028 [Porphyra umbilicalis]|uniref:Uncharacterized protein n=1 Tax=Porphyra umbilicalis TaxID=2786 RepID=A0A1X6PDZ5_PORUM|nr:hypothetical protein BU14_0087s0028 [Porphyra umbilicalis]|eukprot:OSX79081.1 hypothetical protein BU14_0087s0028 [Porphyra umbilicalis]